MTCSSVSFKATLKAMNTIKCHIHVLLQLNVKKAGTILAGNQWWPRTRGGRLRSIRAITYLLRHRIDNFVKGNKRNLHKKTG